MPRWKANLAAIGIILGSILLVFAIGYLIVNYGLYVLALIAVAFVGFMLYELVTGIYEIFKSIRNMLEKEL